MSTIAHAAATPTPRIALIHATALAIAPVADAFARLWPEARSSNLLDDSLSADLAAAGSLDAAMVQRFIDLAQYVERSGADAILFTCSAFGPAIEAAARAVKLQTYKPNEAMFLEALDLAQSRGNKIGLLATFAPTVPALSEELLSMARARAVAIELHTGCAQGAMEALAAGDVEAHDRLVLAHARQLAHCDVLILGQFSMARAQQRVAAELLLPVLTSPDSAVRLLHKKLGTAP